MEYKIFRQRESEQINYDFIRSAMKELGISYLSAFLLNMKGFNDVEDAEMFMSPEFDDLNNPFLFDGMDIFMERLEQAVMENHRVMVFSDYDCDGVCSAVILKKLLERLGIEAIVKIPNRFTNGYGLNTESVKEIIEVSPDLVITSDNGITSVDEVKLLRENGIDVIVTDHHLPGETLPDALCILDAKVKGETYPFKELCGAGVCFKVAQAAREHFSMNCDMSELLVFAMIATIADLVPLVDENRTISKIGLYRMKITSNLGLKTLVRKAGYSLESVNGTTIGYQISPRINAAGRLADANEAVRLFTTDDQQEAEDIAQKLCELNDERKDIEEGIFKRCVEIVEEKQLMKNNRILFIRDDSFHEGVMGVAASGVTDRYNRPAIVMSMEEEGTGLVKASCRSIDGFDIFRCLNHSRDLFEKFGGHRAAAGFSIKEENIEKLIRNSNRFAHEDNIEALFYRTYTYDIEGIPSNMTVKTARELEEFAPFGMGNKRSLMVMRNVRIQNVRVIGKGGNHLKFGVISKGRYYDCIAFGKGNLAGRADFTKNFDIVFTMEINSYRGEESLQLNVKDLDYNMVQTRTFDKAEFASFMYNLDGEDYFYPEEDELIDDRLERCVDRYRDEVLVIYNRDTFVRCIKYLRARGYHYHVSYGVLGYSTGVVNLLVLPTERIETVHSVIALDRPKLNDYETDVYLDSDFRARKCGIPLRTVRISRRFFLHMYSKFRILRATGNDIYNFMDSIQSESDIEVNYYTMCLALEVMKEMKLLNYSIENDKLLLEFFRVNEKKDIEKTRIMRKLKAR